MLAAYLAYVLVYFAIMGAILFVSAGRADLPLFWAYLVVMAIPALAATVVTYRNNPEQLRQQTRPATGGEDRLTVPLFVVSFLAHWVIAGLDVGRFHWSSSVPVALQVIGLIGFGCGFGLVAWSTLVNQFYVGVVRIQDERGQQVITGGPYRFVRHPGYIGWILFYLCSGLALGSWLSILPAALPALATIRRTIIEDRMLHTSLSGYPEYAQRVRYRLIPGVW